MNPLKEIYKTFRMAPLPVGYYTLNLGLLSLTYSDPVFSIIFTESALISAGAALRQQQVKQRLEKILDTTKNPLSILRGPIIKKWGNRQTALVVASEYGLDKDFKEYFRKNKSKQELKYIPNF